MQNMFGVPEICFFTLCRSCWKGFQYYLKSSQQTVHGKNNLWNEVLILYAYIGNQVCILKHSPLFNLILTEAPKFPASSKTKGGKPGKALDMSPPGLLGLNEKVKQVDRKQTSLEIFIQHNTNGSSHIKPWPNGFE